MKVAYSGGEREVNIGDRFRDSLFRRTWEVVAVRNASIYSPTGLGGTPVFGCRLVEGTVPEAWRTSVSPDGLLEFCGDSIAATLVSP